jgi:minichromosome maintenance protein 10
MINSKAQAERQYPKLAPSNVLNKLATLNHKVGDHGPGDRVTRSSGFAESPSNLVASAGAMDVIPAVVRDEHLAIIEDLEPGPVEHTPPSDDPEFQHLEPNSGIRLRSASWTSLHFCMLKFYL